MVWKTKHAPIVESQPESGASHVLSSVQTNFAENRPSHALDPDVLTQQPKPAKTPDTAGTSVLTLIVLTRTALPLLSALKGLLPYL